MKKILFTINFLTNGGPTRVLENIIKSLDKKKYEIYILTLIDENNLEIVKKLEDNGIKVIALKFSKSLKEVLKHKKEIIKIINDINPDIIHTHGIVTTMVVYNLKTTSKKITTIHNIIFEDYKYTYGKIKGLIFAFVHIFMLRKFDNVICCSKTSYEVLKKYVKKSTFIRNGVDLKSSKNISREKIRKELNISRDATIYIYAGVISKLKRVVNLIELFNDSLKENEYLLIVGNGPMLEEAKNASKSKNIIFTGFKDNIDDYFKASDVYVSASSSEGFSISVIEALECNLLLLLSNIPSHKEIFSIDENYYLGETFNDNNFKESKEKVNDALNKKRCVKEFKEKYLSSKKMTQDYEKYYEVK